MYMLSRGPSPRKNSSSDFQGRLQREWSAIENDTSNHFMKDDKYSERIGERKA